MSTPRTLRLPDNARRITLQTPRGEFAALEALPTSGVCERSPALLVPGFTGSKEDFLPIIGLLAAAGRRVQAIDMRGQYETQGDWDSESYALSSLAADVAVIADLLGAPDGRRDGQPGGRRDGQPGGRRDGQPGGRGRHGRRPVHLMGHSFGGLVAREVVLARATETGSLTLMSSGPGALTGPRAAVLREILAALDGLPPTDLAGQVKYLWDVHLEPPAVADGTPPEVVEFLRTRMLASSPLGLVTMARILLSCPDRTQRLRQAAATPLLVLYGEHDDAWAPAIQETMAERLAAQRVCIPGAMHSPAVEAPETTASTLTRFWNAAESQTHKALTGQRA